MKNRLLAVFFLFILAPSLSAQIDQSSTTANIHEVVSVLADDSLRGREAGSAEEIVARDYIILKFEEIGLAPYFEDGFSQAFPFSDGIVYSEKSEFNLAKQSYLIGKNYYPLDNSANADITSTLVDVGFGLLSGDKKVNSYSGLEKLKGKVFLIELSVPGGVAQYQKYAAFADVDSKIDNAIKMGAVGVVFVNSDKDFTDPRQMISNSATKKTIPVIFLSGIEKPVLKKGEELPLRMKFDISSKKETGYNVAAKIDIGAEKNIVIGGHYDHLGMGGRTSRYRGDDPFVHNGADDNASGVAAIIELARYFNEHRSELKHNIIIVAFSAEEKGLLGSDAFVNSESFSPEKTLAMLNFDMIGRLDRDEPKLTLIGTGTCSEWDEIIEELDTPDFKIAKSPSGIGGSDHTKFYLKKIPVLFFFTGIHEQYHMPEDDVELLNIEGETKVVDFAARMMTRLMSFEELTYKKTKSAPKGRHGSAYKVTLGIMPDYANSEVSGLKITAVMDGKPAKKAGLKGGDIIIQVGDIKVGDMGDYMKVLGHFNKGQKAQLKYIREGKEQTTTVIF